MMYAGCFRVGELLKSTSLKHTLKRKNLTLNYQKSSFSSIRIHMPSFKYSTMPVNLVIRPSHDTVVCPVYNLVQYMSLDKAYSRYMFVFRDGNPVTGDWFLKNLRFLLSRLHFNCKLFGTHSFRIGFTTDLAKNGASITEIKTKGRWKSYAFIKYVRPDVIHM